MHLQRKIVSSVKHCLWRSSRTHRTTVTYVTLVSVSLAKICNLFVAFAFFKLIHVNRLFSTTVSWLSFASIEEKTDNAEDGLHFLEQYARGQPQQLVRSCQHLIDGSGYAKAKTLLHEHFGNEHMMVKSSHLHLYSTFNNVDCSKAALH